MALALLKFGMLLWKKKYDIMHIVDSSRRDISSIAALSIIVFPCRGSPWIQSIPDSSSLNQLVNAGSSKTHAHDSANNVSFVSQISAFLTFVIILLRICALYLCVFLGFETRKEI